MTRHEPEGVSGWRRGYVLLYAGAEALLLLLTPLVDDSFVAFTGWLVLIIAADLGLSAWAQRLPETQVGFTRRLRLVNITLRCCGGWRASAACGGSVATRSGGCPRR